MFWSKKKTDKQGKPENKQNGLPAGSNKNTGETGEGRRPGSAELRAQALANVRAARERIGDDAIQKIAAALLSKKQNSITDQAKQKISKADSGRVRDEIRFLMDDD